jgi:hypothetical protein
LAQANVVPYERLKEIIDESNQLRAILSKAVATSKGKARGATNHF